MNFEENHGFDLSEIMSHKILYENAILFIEEFEGEYNTGSILDLGNPYGMSYSEIIKSNYIDFEFSIDNYMDLLNPRLSSNNPIAKANPNVLHSLKMYAELNHKHLPNLGLDWLMFPVHKDDAFNLLDKNEILFNFNIEKDFHVSANDKVENINSVINLDLNSVAKGALNSWFFTKYIFKENKLIGVIKGDLITANEHIDDETYLLNLRQDSDLLDKHGRFIIDNLINDKFSEINEFYQSQFESSVKSGTLHIYEIDILDEFYSTEFVHGCLGSLIDQLSNNSVLNAVKYMEVGFDQSESLSQLKNFYNVITNKNYESNLNIGFISAITIEKDAMFNITSLNSEDELLDFSYPLDRIAIPYQDTVNCHILS